MGPSIELQPLVMIKPKHHRNVKVLTLSFVGNDPDRKQTPPFEQILMHLSVYDEREA